MPPRILVINPNSNEEVTRAMDRALNPLRTDDAVDIEHGCGSEYLVEIRRLVGHGACPHARGVDIRRSKSETVTVSAGQLESFLTRD